MTAITAPSPTTAVPDDIVAPPDPPAADPAPTKKPRGNPNLHLVARCGARTRSGCPCQAPAVRGKLRCRMHGGRSTGPRTPKGLADLRAARTIHGFDGAEARARDRHRLTFLRRARVDSAAQRYQAHLPPAFVARLYGLAPELMPSPRPTGGITAEMDRVRHRAVAAALAPWKRAIAATRVAERAARAAARLAKPHAPVGARPPRGAYVPKPHAPIPGAADLAAAARADCPAKTPAAASPADATQGRRPTRPCPAGQNPLAAPVPKPLAPDRAPTPSDAGAAKPHAPTPGPAATDAILAALPNRAARRRWKSLQRRKHRRTGAIG